MSEQTGKRVWWVACPQCEAIHYDDREGAVTITCWCGKEIDVGA